MPLIVIAMLTPDVLTLQFMFLADAKVTLLKKSEQGKLARHPLPPGL